MSLFTELKRRKVFGVAAAYAVVGWIVVQITTIAQPAFGMPGWVNTVVFYFTLIGFPIALVLAWAFELTPDGIKPTSESGSEPGGQKQHVGALLVFVILGLSFSYWLGGLNVADDIEGDILAGSMMPAAVDVSAPVPGFSGRAAIAVLPFLNMSDDVSQEYFADGITEDIITSLQSLQAFPVIARTSTFSYKGLSLDIRQVTSELGAGYVLEGSVRKVGERVRITAQLIDRQGQHLWAENYDRELKNVFAVQDEITRHIVTAIEPEILATEMDRVSEVRTPDLEAWDYYLQALANSIALFGYTDINGEQVSLERNQKARELALKAVELDPGFARAYTLLSHIEASFLFDFGSEISDESAGAAMERAIGYGERARAISPFDATACSCHAYLLLAAGRNDEALKIQEQNIAANPASSNAHAIYAMNLAANREYNFALKEIHLAERLSPRDIGMSLYMSIEADVYLGLGEFSKALAVADNALFLTQLNFDAQVTRVVSLYVLDRKEEAGAALAEFLEIYPEFNTLFLFDLPAKAKLLEALGLVGTEISYPDLVTRIFTELGWKGGTG